MASRFVFASKWWNSVAGTILCCAAACLLCYTHQESAFKTRLPIVFLAVILAVSLRFGRWAGILGSCAASIIFSYWLFSPIGSLRVIAVENRSNLAWMLLGGIVLSFLLSARETTSENKTEKHT